MNVIIYQTESLQVLNNNIVKILLVHTYYAQRGGEDLVFETEAKQLSKEGVEVQNLAFTNEKRKYLSFLLYPFNVFSFFLMLKKIRKFKPDMVHVHNWHFAASAAILVAAKVSGIPVVQTLHNYRLIHPEGVSSHKKDSHVANGGGNRTTLSAADAILPKLWIRFVAAIHRHSGAWKMVDRYIVLNPAAKRNFMATHFRNVADRFVIKSNFIDSTAYKPAQRKKYFLYVGRLSSDKGVDIILSAFENLPYELRIIGDGPLRRQVELASGKRKNIKYLGFQKFEFIKEAMSECAALIFPSVSDEGMPMTILEAFSCGAPVITSKFSAMETMIEDLYNGMHFIKGDINDLSTRITNYHNLSEEEKKLMRDNARYTYEKNYTPAGNIKQLLLIYSDVFHEKSTPGRHLVPGGLHRGNHVDHNEIDGNTNGKNTLPVGVSDVSKTAKNQMAN